jgi:hypothetical protein
VWNFDDVFVDNFHDIRYKVGGVFMAIIGATNLWDFFYGDRVGNIMAIVILIVLGCGVFSMWRCLFP